MSARALTLGAAALLALAGCPSEKKEAPGDERLLKQLQAEKQRLANGGTAVGPPSAKPAAPAPGEPEPNPLAVLAANPSATKSLPLAGSRPVAFGGGTVSLVSADAMHSVGEAISVTTEDWFVKVVVSAVGRDGLTIDFSGAQLQKGEQTFGLARDAQAASRTQPKVATSPKEAKVALFFEVPEAALGPGLTLVLPADGAEARLLLQ